MPKGPTGWDPRGAQRAHQGGGEGGARAFAERAKRAELTGLDTDTQDKLTVPTHKTSLPYRHTRQACRTDTQYKLTPR